MKGKSEWHGNYFHPEEEKYVHQKKVNENKKIYQLSLRNTKALNTEKYPFPTRPAGMHAGEIHRISAKIADVPLPNLPIKIYTNTSIHAL